MPDFDLIWAVFLVQIGAVLKANRISAMIDEF